MAQINKLMLFLAKPFPQEESFSETLKIIVVISVFVTAFLYIFKPFGIHTLESNQFLLCLGFGSVSLIASLAYEVFARTIRLKPQGNTFTFARWIVYMAGVMLFISLANFIFVRLVLFNDIQWPLFPYMLRGTFSIGLFPVIAIGAFALLRQEKKYQHISKELNEQRTNATAPERSQDQAIFDIPVERIRYIEAMQNYINIGHIGSDGILELATERATLKSLFDQGLSDSIVRCHRSFLVNRESITASAGNAQGLMLTLLGCEKPIPVSRSYVSAFRRH